ncbi:hypothetical protein T459_13696 [Capsicum annuum]|uniref:Peptidase C1A papain C-terminal domain-containing protein n=1 Tax=Capsicum annuum TaxID=4072 RepID=A0A2G2ZFI6_CAPAN|nr:hypothetical protein T459_13696 [Capsicum annuum]
MGPTDREIKEREESLAKGEKDRTHNMLIVGFGMNKDGQDYYLAQNSWVKDGVPWLCWVMGTFLVGDMRLYYKLNPSNVMKSSHLSLDNVKGQAIN